MTTKRFNGGSAAAAVLLSLVVVALVVAGCSRFAARGTLPGPRITEDGVSFRFYAPGAMRVQLAGNWPENNWARGDGSVGEANIGLMKVNADGVWEIVVSLGPGRYQYVFRVDENTWQLDPGNAEEAAGGPMKKTSVVVIFLAGGKLEIR
jgi:1,4-alpha-glucan branching enzyme